MPENRLLTIAEVADRLQIHIVTARRWLREKRFPAYKLGREWRVKESELTEFLETRRQDTISDEEYTDIDK
jgi:excisionase family DNA binding protein